MRSNVLYRFLKCGLCIPLVVLLAACSGDGVNDAGGLSRAEVEEMVQTAIEAIPDSPPGLTSAEVDEIVRRALEDLDRPEPGLSRSQVEEIVSAAVEGISRPQPGLSSKDAERIARGVVASIPPRSDPAAYTKFFVDNAIILYEREGLEATLDHYNREESVEGQWYVFIIDENDLVIAHPDPDRIGLDLKGWVGTDANGYNFGPEMLSATEEGRWVTYVYQNPEEDGVTPGDLSRVDLKNAWVVRHDGLLFASGWYIDVDQFTKDVVADVTNLFSRVGPEAVTALLASDPSSTLGGVAESAVSYNASGAARGEWSIFMGDESGAVVFHFNPSVVGKRVEDLLGTDASGIDEEGLWLTSETMRIWAVSVDGWVFGAGWQDNEAGG